MKTYLAQIALISGTLLIGPALAADRVKEAGALDIDMLTVTENGTGERLGNVNVTATEYGLVFTPDLQGLPPGAHGFHIHEKGSCNASEVDGKKTAAGAAGGHYDPEKTGKHSLPWGDGHLGDLPALYVDTDGKATMPVLAPRLKTLSQISGRSLMIHQGGDNHSDHPSPLGGGGGRIACGVIP